MKRGQPAAKSHGMHLSVSIVGLVINRWHQMKTANISDVMSKSRPRRLVVREVSICVKFGQYRAYQVWNIVPLKNHGHLYAHADQI